MTEAVQIEMWHDLMLMFCGLIAAAVPVGVAWLGARRVVEKIVDTSTIQLQKTAGVHTLVNDHSEKQEKLIASLTIELAELRMTATHKDGVQAGIDQERARNIEESEVQQVK